jgi:hypothetical protein
MGGLVLRLLLHIISHLHIYFNTIVSGYNQGLLVRFPGLHPQRHSPDMVAAMFMVVTLFFQLLEGPH